MDKRLMMEVSAGVFLMTVFLLSVFAGMIFILDGYKIYFFSVLGDIAGYAGFYLFVISAIAGFAPFVGKSTGKVEGTYIITRTYRDMAWESAGNYRSRKYALIFAYFFPLSLIMLALSFLLR